MTRMCLWDAGETLGDDRASTSMLEYMKGIPYVEASVAMNREALTDRSG